MNTAPAGFFSPQVNTMDASSKLPFFPANFIGQVKVAACKGITTRDGARAFIAEVEVISSNMPDKVYVGGKYSWYQSLQEPGTAYPSCIAFLYACLGLDATRDKAKIESVKLKQDQWLNASVSDKNVLAGAVVNLQTASKKTKKGSDFTLHNFSPVAAKAA